MHSLTVSVCRRITDVDASAWDRLAGSANPFLRHAFLAALENHRCAHPDTGWLPQHLLVHRNGRLAGASPMYLKSHSWGEFVFDWAWADAYERAGGRYYPKLVTAVPFTPVPGPRLLTAVGEDTDAVRNALVQGAIRLAEEAGASSVHWLFPLPSEAQHMARSEPLLIRTGCQFHWFNAGYTSFDHYLAGFSAKKRKNVRQERRKVRDAGIRVEAIEGGNITSAQWDAFYGFYEFTGRSKSGMVYLSRPFFTELTRTMPENVVLFMAYRANEPVAGAFCIRSGQTLYGRNWGCSEFYDNLHFETCYYRAIEYCIENGLEKFEAGAQGEHKLSRGFVPTATYSGHWIADPSLRRAVAGFLDQEQRQVAGYMETLDYHLPFKKTGNG